LFPGYYVYDSNFAGGSDHIAAFFALPMLLASMRAAKTFDLAHCALAGLFAGALMHTKFQCFYLVAPVGAYLLGRWVYVGLRLFQGRRTKFESMLRPGNLGWSPLLYLAAFFLSFGPHLLVNWVFYKNPVYPLLPELFPRGPHLDGMPYDPFVLTRNAYSSTVKQAFTLMFTFSVNPQYNFGEPIPTFGSLFTLMSPVTLVSFRLRRLWVAFILSYGALFLWCFTYRIDRNLQLVLPWFVAVTGATIAVAWRSGTLGRLAIVLAIGLQASWGARFMLVGGHERVQSLLNLIRQYPEATLKARYDAFRRPYRELGEKLPQDALLLVHTAHVHLGINRPTIGDWAGWQHVIDYRPMKNARDVYDLYRRLGITHIVWSLQYPATKQEDALFFEFARHYARPLQETGDFRLWAMPTSRPPECDAMVVLARGLYGYPDGLYPVTSLQVFEELPANLVVFPKPQATADDSEGWARLLERADAVLWVKGEAQFEQAAKVTLDSNFEHEHTYYSGYGGRRHAVWLRKMSHMRACH
jgi:hypothetical protein